MTYQQWDHHQHYQGIPEYRPLIQPWQHELGCPTPRPRSYSLGSRPPSSADLTEVSTKRTYNPSPLILPLDCNRNYISTFPVSKSSKSFGSTKNRLFWLILSLVLAVAILSGFAWWKYRTRLSVPVEAFDLPSQPIVHHPPPVSQYPPQQQHQHQQQIPQQPYHPLPPPPPALQSPNQQQQQQQQYAQQAAYWQQQQQQLYHHYQQPQYMPEGYAYQQQPQQQHYSYPPQQQQQQYLPQPAQEQHRQHQSQPVQQQQPPPPPQHHPNVLQHHGEPNAQKPWILQHMNTPAPAVQNAPEPVQEQRHYEHVKTQQQQQEQQPPVQPKEPEPELSRQEERAKARNEARSSNPKTSSKKIHEDDIWEREPVVERNESHVPVGDLKTLRFEPAMFSFNQSVEGSDGIIYLTSYEDSEDVTVEVFEEA